MGKRYFILILATAFLVSTAGFIRTLMAEKPASTPKTNEFTVSASFYPLYFFAQSIGGEKVKVQTITPPGTEPHDFEPTAQDLVRIENSDLLILNGTVEPWADKIAGIVKGKTIIAGENLFTRMITEDEHTEQDPHIWLNPNLAKQQVERIAKGFVEADPANTAYYTANEAALIKKLTNLDQQYRQGLSQCQTTDIITSHAAFGYLTQEYGLNQVPISGITPDVEPSTIDLVEVAEFAREHGIQYIFFERLVSPKLAETIAQEVGAQTLVLDPIEGLSDDEIKSGKNYFTIMEENLNNLQIGLQCI